MKRQTPRILLLGATGQVGFELWRSLQPLGSVQATTRSAVPGALQVDLSKADDVHPLLQQQQPDIIVNAAAWTAVDAAEQEEEACWRLNAGLPEQLAQYAAQQGCLLLHYSTDYVFDGSAQEPLDEARPTRPLGAYGRSKHEGERAIQQSGCAHLLFRTAWVYASRGRNFLRTMLRLAAERESLSIVDDQIGTPTSARLIADASTHALQSWLAQGASLEDARLGLWHLVASGQTSWYGFAHALLHQAQELGLIARVPELHPISTQEYPTPARRPAWSVLDNRAVQRAFDLHLPDWRAGMQLCLLELAQRGDST